MRRPPRLRIPYAWAWAVIIAWSAASPARAWTEAEIQTLAAKVELRDEDIRVEMDLRLHIRGGWLEHLDVAGLDEGLVLEDGARFTDEQGRALTPRVRERNGRVAFDFHRRSAPRRGDYRIRFAYTAPAPAIVDGVGRWTLPGWRTGLDGVVVEIVGDAIDFAPGTDALVTIARRRREEGDRTYLRWQRAHLPRTVPWTVAFAVPHAPSAAAAVSEVPAAPQAQEPTSEPARIPHAPLRAALLCLLAAFFYAGRARRFGSRARPLIPLPLLRGAGLLALVAGAEYVPFGWGAVALVVLSWERTPCATSASRLGAWRAMQADDALPAVHRPWDALFDGSTLAGALVAAIAAGAAAQHVEVLYASVVLIPWLSGNRNQLPTSLDARKSRLVEWAESLRSDGSFALRFAVHEDAKGRPQDVRIRVHTEKRVHGLHRLDVAVADRVGHGGVVGEVSLVVVVREGSPAAALAEEKLEGSMRTPGGRIAYVLSTDQLETVLMLFASEAPVALPRRQQRPVRPRAQVRHHA